MQERSGLPSAAMGTQPIICPLNETATARASTPVCASSRCVVMQTASHQSSGFCSAQFGCG